MEPRTLIIGVLGGGGDQAVARAVGEQIARAGCRLACGGGEGVMRAAAEGARSKGGDVIGILPGRDPATANEFVNIPIATGLGEARNCVLATCSDAVIAIGGGAGTLSEVAFALKLGKRVVAIASPWSSIPGVIEAETAAEAGYSTILIVSSATRRPKMSSRCASSRTSTRRCSET